MIQTAAADLRRTGVLTLPVSATTAGQLAVQVSRANIAGTGACPPATTTDSDAWLRVLPDSALTYQPTRIPDSPAAFLEQPGGTLVVTGLWDTPEHQAASAAIVGALQYAARSQVTDVQLAEDVPAEAEPSNRNVKIVPTGDAPELTPDGLQIPASADAAAQLLQTVPAPGATANSNSLSLGGSGTTLPEQIHFSVGDLHGWPADLGLTLRSNSSLAADASARMFTRVMLNGVLVDMVDSHDDQRTVPLPSVLLRSDNTLELTSVSAPGSETCARDGPAYIGPVDGAASLNWTRFGAPRAKLPELAARLQGQGELLLPSGSPGEARAAARVLGVLNRWTATPLLPALAQPDQLDAPIHGNYRLIFGAAPSAAPLLGLPLDIQSSLAVSTRSAPESPLLTGTPDHPYIAIEYLPDGPPVLAVTTTPDADDEVLDRAFQRLTTPATFATLDGNVVLADAKDQVVIDLTSMGLIASATPPPSWVELLSAYRWVLLLPIGVLIILFWVGVYRGVGQPPPSAVRPDNTPAGTQP